jgi:hypothetical protein
VYVGGLLLVFVALLLQVLWRIDALLPALVLWGLTRIALSAWQLFQPDVAIGPNPSPGRLSFTIVAWTLVALLITVELSR